MLNVGDGGIGVAVGTIGCEVAVGGSAVDVDVACGGKVAVGVGAGTTPVGVRVGWVVHALNNSANPITIFRLRFLNRCVIKLFPPSALHQRKINGKYR